MRVGTMRLDGGALRCRLAKLGRGRIDDRGHLEHAIGGKAAAPCVLADHVRVRRDVHARRSYLSPAGWRTSLSVSARLTIQEFQHEVSRHQSLMDNVTHSLGGLLLAECAVRLRARRAGVEPSARFRAVAAVSSLIAANLPDADLFYTGVGGDRLRYMLHHRGYSHTVVAALIGAALVYGAALLVWRWRAHRAPAAADARWLLGLLVVSTLSHLVLDWTNSYGVHPFWPFDDRWYYGDSVFIVEPWLWVVSVPALVAASGARVVRLLLSLVLLAGLALAWRVELVSTGAATALTIGAALLIGLAVVLRPATRAITAVAGWLAVTAVMAAGSARARETAVRAARESDPAEVLDVVVSPLPANAVCMAVIVVERSGVSYRVATARVSAAPSITEGSRCGARSGAAGTFQPATRRSTPAIHWDAEWTAPTDQLVTLARESCPALAALRFIRVPIWRDVGGETVLLGDVRFGGGSGNGFSDVRVPRRSPACPEATPPWIPPRAALLRQNGGGVTSFILQRR
jgi:inner membrane protein